MIPVTKFINNINYRILIQNIVLIIVTTVILLHFPNKSNISIYIIIPMITSLLAKYLLGDLDKGFQWSASDIVYWVSLYVFSASTIWIYNKL